MKKASNPPPTFAKPPPPPVPPPKIHTCCDFQCNARGFCNGCHEIVVTYASGPYLTGTTAGSYLINIDQPGANVPRGTSVLMPF